MKLITLVFFTLSCSFFGKPWSQSQSYTLPYIPPTWSPTDPDEADWAYTNSQKTTFFVVQSTCQKYDSTSLKHTTSNLLGDFSHVEQLQSTSMTMADRQAIENTFKALLDGVPVYLIIRTLKKNRCTYDFMMISKSLKELEKEKGPFHKVLSEARID